MCIAIHVGGGDRSLDPIRPKWTCLTTPQGIDPLNSPPVVWSQWRVSGSSQSINPASSALDTTGSAICVLQGQREGLEPAAPRTRGATANRVAAGFSQGTSRRNRGSCGSCGSHGEGLQVMAFHCPTCHTVLRDEALPCPRCFPGAPARQPTASGATVAHLWTQVRDSWMVPPDTPSPPAQLWAVIAVMGVVGAVSLGWSLWAMVTVLPVFSDGPIGVALGVFVIEVLTVPICFGIGSVYLARRLQGGDRVAWFLTITIMVPAAVAFLLTGARDLTLVLIAIGCLGIAAVLLFDPATKAHFRAHGDEPPPVVAARVLMVVVGCCNFIVGVAFLPLVELEGVAVLYGLFDMAIGVATFMLSRRISAGDPTARVLVTGTAMIYGILSVIAGHGEPGVILPVGMALGTVGLLWAPRSSRMYFASLPRPTQPAIAAVERAIDNMIAAMTASAAPAGATVSAPPPPAAPSTRSLWAPSVPPAYVQPPSVPPPVYAFCINCGTRLGPQARFCARCGTPVGTSSTPTGSPNDAL